MANSKAKNKNRIAKIIATIIIIITIIVFHLAIKYVAYPVAGFFLFGGISKGEVLHITVKEPLTYDELNTNYSGTADWFSNVNSLSVYQLKKYMKKNDKQIEPGLYFIEPYCYYETLLAELSFSDVLEEDRVLTEQFIYRMKAKQFIDSLPPLQHLLLISPTGATLTAYAPKRRQMVQRGNKYGATIIKALRAIPHIIKVSANMQTPFLHITPKRYNLY